MEPVSVPHRGVIELTSPLFAIRQVGELLESLAVLRACPWASDAVIQNTD